MWIIIALLVMYILYDKFVKNSKGKEIDILEENIIENGENEIKKNEINMLNPPFQMSYSLLTKAELEFYNVLKKVIDTERQIICPKVRILDILWVKTYVKNKQAFLNKVNRKHLDFVVCSASNLKPLYAVELDDKTHEQEERKERDEFVDALLDRLNFKVIRIKWQAQYDEEKIRLRLNEELKKESISDGIS